MSNAAIPASKAQVGQKYRNGRDLIVEVLEIPEIGQVVVKSEAGQTSSVPRSYPLKPLVGGPTALDLAYGPIDKIDAALPNMALADVEDLADQDMRPEVQERLRKRIEELKNGTLEDRARLARQMIAGRVQGLAPALQGAVLEIAGQKWAIRSLLTRILTDEVAIEALAKLDAHLETLKETPTAEDTGAAGPTPAAITEQEQAIVVSTLMDELARAHHLASPCDPETPIALEGASTILAPLTMGALKGMLAAWKKGKAQPFPADVLEGVIAGVRAVNAPPPAKKVAVMGRYQVVDRPTGNEKSVADVVDTWRNNEKVAHGFSFHAAVDESHRKNDAFHGQHGWRRYLNARGTMGDLPPLIKADDGETRVDEGATSSSSSPALTATSEGDVPKAAADRVKLVRTFTTLGQLATAREWPNYQAPSLDPEIRIATELLETVETAFAGKDARTLVGLAATSKAQLRAGVLARIRECIASLRGEGVEIPDVMTHVDAGDDTPKPDGPFTLEDAPAPYRPLLEVLAKLRPGQRVWSRAQLEQLEALTANVRSCRQALSPLVNGDLETLGALRLAWRLENVGKDRATVKDQIASRISWLGGPPPSQEDLVERTEEIDAPKITMKAGIEPVKKTEPDDTNVKPHVVTDETGGEAAQPADADRGLDQAIAVHERLATTEPDPDEVAGSGDAGAGEIPTGQPRMGTAGAQDYPRKAREAHTCSSCSTPIAIGTEYRFIQRGSGNRRETLHVHMACDVPPRQPLTGGKTGMSVTPDIMPMHTCRGCAREERRTPGDVTPCKRCKGTDWVEGYLPQADRDVIRAKFAGIVAEEPDNDNRLDTIGPDHDGAWDEIDDKERMKRIYNLDGDAREKWDPTGDLAELQGEADAADGKAGKDCPFADKFWTDAWKLGWRRYMGAEISVRPLVRPPSDPAALELAEGHVAPDHGVEQLEATPAEVGLSPRKSKVFEALRDGKVPFTPVIERLDQEDDGDVGIDDVDHHGELLDHGEARRTTKIEWTPGVEDLEQANISGRHAGEDGQPRTACSYKDEALRAAWLQGWETATLAERQRAPGRDDGPFEEPAPRPAAPAPRQVRLQDVRAIALPDGTTDLWNHAAGERPQRLGNTTNPAMRTLHETWLRAVAPTKVEQNDLSKKDRKRAKQHAHRNSDLGRAQAALSALTAGLPALSALGLDVSITITTRPPDRERL